MKITKENEGNEKTHDFKFLGEVCALMKKHGIEKLECGCCGSLIIGRLNENMPPKLLPGIRYWKLEYDEEKGGYLVEELRNEEKIIKETVD